MTEASGQGTRRTSMLGEELPIFCEKCGYALMGLPQHVCERCDIRQFHCPECGHHQPVNTLRPAFQKLLGRIRAGWLTLVVFCKLNFFGWLLFLWGVLGSEFSYTYQRALGYNRAPFTMSTETLIGFGIFALVFGFLGRLLLLRWANGAMVGLVLGALVAGAILMGAYITAMELDTRRQQISLFNSDFMRLTSFSAGTVVLSTTAAWSIWHLLVKAFLPRRTANSLLEWQRNLSVSDAAVLSKSE